MLHAVQDAARAEALDALMRGDLIETKEHGMSYEFMVLCT
jgi:hypothetical protein